MPVGDDAETARRCAVCQEALQVKHSDDEDCWVYADTVRYCVSSDYYSLFLCFFCCCCCVLCVVVAAAAAAAAAVAVVVVV